MNDAPHSNGTSATWKEGVNIVEITASHPSYGSKVYKVVVEK